MTNATSRVRHIARIARNDVKVEMCDRLTGGNTAVEADVVAVGVVPVVEPTLYLVNETDNVLALLSRRVPPGAN